jgi:hypothetical protein
MVRNQWAGFLALFLVLAGAPAYAAIIVSSNSEVAENTISGHKPPAGVHANIIGGSVNAADLAATPAQAVRPAPSAPGNCDAASPTVGTFCRSVDGALNHQGYWQNYGNGYQPAGYFKDDLGVVNIQGHVATRGAGDGVPATIFILPSGLRPKSTRLFHVYQEEDKSDADGTFEPDAWVRIQTDGRVVHGSHEANLHINYLQLDGIFFQP